MQPNFLRKNTCNTANVCTQCKLGNRNARKHALRYLAMRAVLLYAITSKESIATCSSTSRTLATCALQKDNLCAPTCTKSCENKHAKHVKSDVHVNLKYARLLQQQCSTPLAVPGPLDGYQKYISRLQQHHQNNPGNAHKTNCTLLHTTLMLA